MKEISVLVSNTILYPMVPEERGVRLQKLEELKKLGMDPYPARSGRTAACERAHEWFETWSAEGTVVTLAGRVRSIRQHGGSAFVVIEDGTGKFQLFFRRDAVGDEQFSVIKNLLDLGDFIEATGTLFLTKTGEQTLEVGSDPGFRILSKALLPLPEQWHGLSDIETRFRQRYLDLIANEEVRKVFQHRATVIKTIRSFFEDEGFLEVETPVLQSIPGGATARPFLTHHNALDIDMYLRIAPELYLKRLIVGGYERVFEFARCFRNEGIDHTHNPEFTMLEAYIAYADYHLLMNMMENLFRHVVLAVHGGLEFAARGQTLSFANPFPRVSFRDAIADATGIDIADVSDAELKKQAGKLGVDVEKNVTRGQIFDDLLKKYVVSKTMQPTFLIDHPIELSPLSKKKADDPRFVERFQLVFGGVEVVNAFSELNDPQDQLARFCDQQKAAEAGDEEAHRIDMDYVHALEYGMPPTAGLGIGIDRLVCLLTDNANIKEVILFPTLRPKTEN